MYIYKDSLSTQQKKIQTQSERVNTFNYKYIKTTL